MTTDRETGERRRNRLVEALPIVLVTALVTGLGVAVYYETRGGPKRDASGAEDLQLLQYNRGMRKDEKITRRDVVTAPVWRDVAEQLGTVVQAESVSFLIGRKLRENVNPGQWVQWSHVQGGQVDDVDGKVAVPPGYVALTIELHPATPACPPGARINVLGEFPEEVISPSRVIRLIRNVQVCSVGTGSPPRAVGIEVRAEESAKLLQLLLKSGGRAMVEVLPADTEFDETKDGIVNPDGDKALERLLRPAPSP